MKIIVLLCIVVLNCFKLISGQDIINTNNLRIKVSDKLIHSIRSYDYKSNSGKVVNEVLSLIPQDTANMESDNLSGCIMNTISIDLDGDLHDEIAGLFGVAETETYLTVFKMIKDTWYIICAIPVNVYYRAPELNIANNFSKNKVFYVRQLNGRGTGVYMDTYHFYKIIDGYVYHCLEIVNSEHITGIDLGISQEMNTKVQFSACGNDEVVVEYNYNFYRDGLEDTSKTPYPLSEVSFVKGDQFIYYNWDNKSHSYKPEFYDNDSTDLNNEKIACFKAQNNDSLFVKAFRYELKKKLKEGTAYEQQVLAESLEDINKYFSNAFSMEKRKNDNKIR